MNTTNTTMSKEEIVYRLKNLSEGNADVNTLAEVIIKMSEETKTPVQKILKFIENDIKIRKSENRLTTAMNTFMGEAI